MKAFDQLTQKVLSPTARPEPRSSAIVESLTREPELREAWHRAALAVGAVLSRLSHRELGELMEGIARIDVQDCSEWINGTKRTLLTVLAGRSRSRAMAREDRATDAELKAAPHAFWTIAEVLSRNGGVMTIKEVQSKVIGNPDRVVAFINDMHHMDLLECLPLDPNEPDQDQGTRICRLRPRGERLAELARMPKKKKHR